MKILWFHTQLSIIGVLLLIYALVLCMRCLRPVRRAINVIDVQESQNDHT